MSDSLKWFDLPGFGTGYPFSYRINGEFIPKDIGDKETIPHLPLIISEKLKAGNIEHVGSKLRVTSTTGLESYETKKNEFDWNGVEDTAVKTKSGTIATGDQVQQWDGIFDFLSKDYDRKTIALDMESFSVAKLAEANNRTPWIIAKGVGDFARNGKAIANGLLASFACKTSFLFVVEFISAIQDTP